MFLIMESTLYLLRHLGAREPHFIQGMRQIVGASEGIFGSVGYGEHPDGESHLIAKDYLLAEEIGAHLQIPKNPRIFLGASPLPRAEETNRHVYVGVTRRHAESLVDNFRGQENQKRLSSEGLLAITDYGVLEGLNESTYRDSQGNPDRGVELINQTNCPETKDPNFPKYRFLVQKGFEGDNRSEHPQSVADRALRGIVPLIQIYDLVLTNSHQPNVEIVTAALSGNIGKNANDLWDLAGGDIALGGGIKLDTYYNILEKRFTHAHLLRTPKGVTPVNGPEDFCQELFVDLDVLNRF
jgi:hypothetical protein